MSMINVKVGEVWTFNVPLTNDNAKFKPRPVLIVSVNNNFQHYYSVTYVIISSTSLKEKFDVIISDKVAKKIGLEKRSIIKTAMVYTGGFSSIGEKIGVLPENIMDEFEKNYKAFQKQIFDNFD
jgi:mRNA-degrading endonuclease toxin of MazEF toxin-antitoxin module